MNILLINHYAGSTRHGMEFRPFYLAREWVRAGHCVQIVAASFSHIRAIQPELNEFVLNEQIEGIDYRWYATPSYQGNGAGRVKNMLAFMRALWRDGPRLARVFKPDVVIASSTYPMDIWPARRIAKLANAKLVYEVHDLWPLSPMELGRMSKWHPFIMWVQMAEDYAYRHADKVVSILPKAKEYMCSRGMAPQKFVYVPNGVDEEEWAQSADLPQEVKESLDALRAKGLPLVGYAGTHGLSNALDVLLDAASRLKGKAEVVMVGMGPDREALLARVASEGLTNVTMLPAIPKQSIPRFLDDVDIAYIGWHPNPLYRFGISPNKLMDYMMAGKPVVHSVSAGNDPVTEAGCGITVPPGDIVAVVDAVLELAAMSQSARNCMGQAGKTAILQNQTYKVLAKRFLNSDERSLQ
ncbi:glycosyltransferase family 4 protein [Polaromonas sp. DSR2-3-2]|uniref:glycosyltransferase family 4 protein n=1 Tax=unclassified Polaromonas TaxID=2638319 RepID=UPI003CEF75A2